jgi:hypothetical protein
MTDNPILEEYRLCHEATWRIDEHNWMWGSFLFGGSLAAVGLVFSQHVGLLRLLALASLSSVVLGGYVLIVRRTIPIKDAYFSRMREIEATYMQAVMIGRQLDILLHNPLARFGYHESPIRLPWLSRLQVLVLMVVSYLGALWFGVSFLVLTR